MNLSTASSTRRPSPPPESAEKILVRGIHFNLSPALRDAALSKGARLLRHHRRIMRVRIDLEHHPVKDAPAEFVAIGRLEVAGPDLIVRVTSEAAAKSLDLLIDKLDRMLRERSRTRTDRRNNRPAGSEFRDRLAPTVSHLAGD